MEDHLADFEALRKMLITPEQSKIASSALRRSKENSFLYRSVSLKVQIEKKISTMKKLIKCPAKVLLVGLLLDQSKSKGLCGAPFTLSNGENRRSLSCSYQELFKK
jgi:hypothetical protein